MYKNKSYVTLYNLPIQLSNINNINWSVVDKDTYFNSIQDKVTFDDFTDLYRERGFALPGNCENLRKYNYMKLHYENEVGVNKDFYCIVEGFKYISQEVSVPLYNIDAHTTFGSYVDMSINVNRETPDTTKTEYLLDEDFQPPRYNITNKTYDTSRYYVIRLNKSINGYIPSGKINLNYGNQNVTTFNLDAIYVLCNINGLFDRLHTEYTEYITDVYSVTGYQLGSFKNQVNSSNYVYIYNQTINIGETMTINKPNGYTNFLARYPYFYVEIGDTMYDPIDFINQTPTFAVFPTFIRNMGIVYIPTNYKGESLNKSFISLLDPCSSIGATMYNENSLATQESIELANRSISAASTVYNANQAMASLNKSYQIDMAGINNEVDLYKWARLKKDVADEQNILGFGLGGGSLIGGVFKALGKSVRNLLTGGVDPEELGEEEKASKNWVEKIINSFIKKFVLNPLADMVEALGDGIKSAVEAAEQAIGGELLSDDKTGFNREQMLSEAKQAQVEYAGTSYSNTVSSLANARDAAVAQASTDKKYAGLQANIIMSSDYVGNYLAFTFPLVYAIDSGYIDDVKAYYDYFGAYINENRVGKVVKNTGNYYYFKGTILRTDTISYDDLLEINKVYSNGIRLYNTTDPTIFGKL